MDDNKATSSGMLPVLASRNRTWDSDAAIARVRTFTGSTDEPSSTYRSAFLYYIPDEAENFSGYKLPIADVVDGRMVAIPRGIFSAAGVMNGAMGGVDVPDRDRAVITRKINRYYNIMS